jgi:hypothetical protein
MDPLSVAITLGVLGVGWLIGRHGRLKSAPKQPKPICLCGHQYGAHDPNTGDCGTAELERVNYRDVWSDCACVRYTGPQPVEQYWVPPAADMSIVTAPREVDR